MTGEAAPATKKRTSQHKLLLVAVVLGVVFALPPVLLRAFAYEAYKIPASSMMPTLFAGDHLWVSKSSYGERGPPRGHAVVFESPENEGQDYIKRVLARGGDTVAMKDGRPFINEWPVPSCSIGTIELAGFDGPQKGEMLVEFLEDSAYLVFYADDRASDAGRWTVPPGQFFMVGDNRNNSHDSRMWFQGKGGGVRREKIRGRAAFVWLAQKPDGGLDWSGIGSLLGAPKFPARLPRSPRDRFDRCLAERPTRALATPPAPP